jgi:hypothetical protein
MQQFDEGISIGQGGRLVRGDDDAAAGLHGQEADRTIDAGAEIDDHMVIIAGQAGNAGAQREQAVGRHIGQALRAGAAGNDVEGTVGEGGDGPFQRPLLLQHLGQIDLRGDAKLNVDICETKIAVQQDNAAT